MQTKRNIHILLIFLIMNFFSITLYAKQAVPQSGTPLSGTCFIVAISLTLTAFLCFIFSSANAASSNRHAKVFLIVGFLLLLLAAAFIGYGLYLIF